MKIHFSTRVVDKPLKVLNDFNRILICVYVVYFAAVFFLEVQVLPKTIEYNLFLANHVETSNLLKKDDW